MTQIKSELHHPYYAKYAFAFFAFMALLPLFEDRLIDAYYIGFTTRIMIFVVAAASLNLILGFGGMVSFGHAAFLGVGAYAVGILMFHGVASACISWPSSMVIGGLAALVIGAISLRTRGVYFIMITLAFAQMLYFVFVSSEQYGGDDGLPLPGRSTMPFGLNPNSNITYFYIVLLINAAVLFGMHRLTNSRFGRVLQGIRENEDRMEAVGYAVFRYKLLAFVLAGALAGLAGALLANQNGMVSPSAMAWTQSGSLMIMVILGGVGHIYGSVFGAALVLILEEALSSYTVHWQLPMGIILLAVVLFAPNGVMSLLRPRSHD